MVPMNVAVVPYSPELIAAGDGTGDLTRVTAALQIQVTRDFGPIWGITATVTPFLSLDYVPTGYLAVVLAQSLPGGGHGVHFAAGGRPFALVKYESLSEPGNWSVMASHELLEMLVDPWGNRVISGRSLEPGQEQVEPGQEQVEPGQEQVEPGGEQVEYLLEICDPCQMFTYLIDGVLVSDFVTPDYYSPQWTKDLRYSFTGKINKPRVVAPGGYITWREPGTEHIYQQRGPLTPENTARQLTGSSPLVALSLREWVDSHDIAADDVGFMSLESPEFPNRDILDMAKAAYAHAAVAAQRYGGALARDIGRLLPQDATPRRLDVADFMAALGDESQDLYDIYVDPTRGPRDAFDAFTKEHAGKYIDVDLEDVPEQVTNPATREVFAWVAERLREGGDIFGDGLYAQGGPRWWLQALGGG